MGRGLSHESHHTEMHFPRMKRRLHAHSLQIRTHASDLLRAERPPPRDLIGRRHASVCRCAVWKMTPTKFPWHFSTVMRWLVFIDHFIFSKRKKVKLVEVARMSGPSARKKMCWKENTPNDWGLHYADREEHFGRTCIWSGVSTCCALSTAFCDIGNCTAEVSGKLANDPSSGIATCEKLNDICRQTCNPRSSASDQH